MIPSQRDTVILYLLEQHGVVTVDQIRANCNCSLETARRDLRRLEEKGRLTRTHGGAVPINTGHQPPIKINGNGLLEARASLVDRTNVLIVTPSETKATSLLVERSRRAGIPLVAEATNYRGATTVVSVDNYRAGLEAGRWAAVYAKQHFEGQVVVLDVSYPQPNTEARSRGFADGLRDLPANQVTLVRVDGGAVRDMARQITADVLTVHPEINIIFGINDAHTLGALDAYRAAELDESRLLMVSFGLEGNEVKALMEQTQPYTISVAMFPELVGRACVDAAICTYHQCPLPERIITPFTIVTPETLEDFYQRDSGTGEWHLNWTQAEQLPTASVGLTLLRQCQGRPNPKRMGYVGTFSAHEWYQNVYHTMQKHTNALGISLEFVDASQDMVHEIDALKQTIGAAAARFVFEGDTIIVDAGVTTAHLARALRGRQRITVITNSLPVLTELSREKGIALVSTGGMVRSEGQVLVGPGAEASLQDLRVDKAFISITGLSVDFGLSNTNMAEATVKQAMINAAREVILLADHTKIGNEALVKIASLERTHRLITDIGISAHDRLELTQRGIEVSIAEEGINLS